MSTIRHFVVLNYSLLLLVLAMLAACPKPRNNVVTIANKSAEQVLQSLLHQRAQGQSLSGLTRIEYFGRDGLFKGDADLAVERPGRLRMDLRSFFGQPLASLASDGTQIIFVDSRSMQARCGLSSDPLLRDLLPGGLAPEQTVALMLGSLALPRLQHDQAYRVQYFPPLRKGNLALRWMSSEYEIIIEADAEARQILGVRQIERQTQSWWSLKFSDFAESKMGPFPLQAELSWSDRRGTLKWRWKDYILNPPARSALFWQIQIPASFAVIGECHTRE